MPTAPSSAATSQPWTTAIPHVQALCACACSCCRYAAFIRLMHFKDTPSEVPLTYPIVEAFRLTMLSMTHPDFSFNVLGSVLARNSTWMLRPLTVDESLVHRWVNHERYWPACWLCLARGSYNLVYCLTQHCMTCSTLSDRSRRGNTAQSSACTCAVCATI